MFPYETGHSDSSCRVSIGAHCNMTAGTIVAGLYGRFAKPREHSAHSGGTQTWRRVFWFLGGICRLQLQNSSRTPSHSGLRAMVGREVLRCTFACRLVYARIHRNAMRILIAIAGALATCTTASGRQFVSECPQSVPLIGPMVSRCHRGAAEYLSLDRTPSPGEEEICSGDHLAPSSTSTNAG